MYEYHLVFTRYEFAATIILAIVAVVAIFLIRRFVANKETASVFIAIAIIFAIVLALSPVRAKMSRQEEEDIIASAYNDIYQEGYSDGYEEGYNEGYQDGISK